MYRLFRLKLKLMWWTADIHEAFSDRFERKYKNSPYWDKLEKDLKL